MPIYTYLSCPSCGAPAAEIEHPMSEAGSRLCGCGTRLRQDYRAKRIKTNTFWLNKTSFYDRMPAAVKGAGPNSQEYRRYAEQIETLSSDPQFASAPALTRRDLEMLEPIGVAAKTHDPERIAATVTP